MRRTHFLPHLFGFSDSAIEEALHDIPLLRQFASLYAFEDTISDETAILKFRHLREAKALALVLSAEVTELSSQSSILQRFGFTAWLKHIQKTNSALRKLTSEK